MRFNAGFRPTVAMVSPECVCVYSVYRLLVGWVKEESFDRSRPEIGTDFVRCGQSRFIVCLAGRVVGWVFYVPRLTGFDS